MCLGDDVLGECCIFSFAVKSKLIFWFAIWNLVELEPFDRSPQKAREEFLDILNIFHLISKRVVDVNSEKLPVSFTFVDQRQSSKDFHLHDIATFRDTRSNFTHVDRIVVTFTAGGFIDMIRIFPSLWQSAVVPDVSFVRENVGDESQFFFLYVLLDGIQRLGQGDLLIVNKLRNENFTQEYNQSIINYLHLRVRPSGNFHDHIINLLVDVGE